MAPRPVPDLDAIAPTPGVTDEDRNRFGVLLDHAAERGLLTPAEYRLRLEELAGATSVDAMQRIVTELPAFGTVVAASAAAGGPSPVPGLPADPNPARDLDAALWAGLTPATPRRGHRNPWVALAVVMAVLLAALVGLAMVAAHVSHAHAGVTTGIPVVGVSLPRL